MAAVKLTKSNQRHNVYIDPILKSTGQINDQLLGAITLKSEYGDWAQLDWMQNNH